MAHETKVLGVLAGEDLPLPALRRWADSADIVVAADSAADRLLACGANVDIIVGDLDSVTDQARHSAREVIRLDEQETTDCDKLLTLVARRGHAAMTLVSVEGSQPDHELATLHSVAISNLHIRIAYRRGIGHLLRGPSDSATPVHKGERISLIPVTACEGVHFEGVRWPLRNADLSPAGFSSVSNVAVGDRIRVEMRSGCALLYVECGPEPHWP